MGRGRGRVAFVPAPGGGSSGVEDWTQLTSTEQGASPYDPGTLGDTGTTFDNDKFTVVYTSSTTDLDGYRENILRWSTTIQGIWSDFDPLVDIVEVAIDFRTSTGGQLPQSANNGSGIFAGIGDRLASADLANLNGCYRGVHNAGVSNYALHSLTTTSETQDSIVDQSVVYSRFSWVPNVASPLQVRSVITTWSFDPAVAADDISTLSSVGDVMLASDLSTWRLETGCPHIGTVAATGVTPIWRLYYRRFQRPSGQLT